MQIEEEFGIGEQEWKQLINVNGDLHVEHKAAFVGSRTFNDGTLKSIWRENEIKQ